MSLIYYLGLTVWIYSKNSPYLFTSRGLSFGSCWLVKVQNRYSDPVIQVELDGFTTQHFNYQTLKP